MEISHLPSAQTFHFATIQNGYATNSSGIIDFLAKIQMRDYLYFWHDSEQRFLVASGIELKDLVDPTNVAGGLLLLAHGYSAASFDCSSRFEYVPRNELALLKEADAYSWGDVCWTDYAGDSFPDLIPQEIAELLYFRHTGKPFGRVGFPNLRNKFLFSGHDDGWLLKIFYDSWGDVAELLAHLPLLQNLAIRERVLGGSTGSFWIDQTGITEEDPTLDIDSILNRRIKKAQKGIDPKVLPAFSGIRHDYSTIDPEFGSRPQSG